MGCRLKVAVIRADFDCARSRTATGLIEAVETTALPKSRQIKVNQGKNHEEEDENEDDPPSSNFGAAREDCPETLKLRNEPNFSAKKPMKVHKCPKKRTQF